MYKMLLDAAAAGSQQGGGLSMLIPLALVFVIMWLFMIRPQRKQQKALEEMRRNLQKGDKVITAGGIYGIIAESDEKTVLIKVDGDVKLRVDKNSIQKEPDTEAKATANKEDKK